MMKCCYKFHLNFKRFSENDFQDSISLSVASSWIVVGEKTFFETLENFKRTFGKTFEKLLETFRNFSN